MAYKASTRIKVNSEPVDGENPLGVKVGEYVEVGDDVSEGDFDDWDDLVAAKAVVEDDEFDRIHPELVLGSNQPMGTPSNLAQIEGTKLQVNLPDPDKAEEAPTAPGPYNPADPVRVDGAVDPGSGEDSHGQDVDEDDLPDGGLTPGTDNS
jgi:hypothetical protein